MSRDLILIGPDQPGRLAGIITLHDLMIDRVLQQPRGAGTLAALRVADLMTRDVSTALFTLALQPVLAEADQGAGG
jgi:CBS domain-containing membrane protein